MLERHKKFENGRAVESGRVNRREARKITPPPIDFERVVKPKCGFRRIVTNAKVPDPIGTLVASFARPGGNVTGFTNFDISVAGKWLEFLKDVAPGLGRVSVMLDAMNPTAAAYEKAIEAAASTALWWPRPTPEGNRHAGDI